MQDASCMLGDVRFSDLGKWIGNEIGNEIGIVIGNVSRFGSLPPSTCNLHQIRIPSPQNSFPMKKGKSSPHLGSLALLKETLTLFMQKDITADRALNEIFRKHKLRDERMRAELARRFYGIIRSWRPLVTAMGTDEFESMTAIRELVEMWNAWRKICKGEEPAFTGPAIDRLKKYSRVRKMRESFPDWIDDRAIQELGEAHWEKLSHELNQEPKLFLRVNTLKTNREELVQVLRDEEVDAEPVAGTADTLLVKQFVNIFQLPSFKAGLYEMQDYASQIVAPFLDLKPGMRVADGCAGNGGKTLHIAALMQNKGKIVALDVSPRKLDELRTRCTRNGVDLVETKLVDSEKVIQQMKGTFDRLLLDVPCSGTGVMKRNPDIRWRLIPAELEQMIREQKQILESNSSLVKPGGKLVYATCSIFPSEGEEQVRAFLKSHESDWELEEELRVDPVSSPGDGFYLARMKNISGKKPD